MKRNSEEDLVEFEREQLQAMENYFDAREELMRSRPQELLFEAGFRMAWEMYKKDK